MSAAWEEGSSSGHHWSSSHGRTALEVRPGSSSSPLVVVPVASTIPTRVHSLAWAVVAPCRRRTPTTRSSHGFGVLEAHRAAFEFIAWEGVYSESGFTLGRELAETAAFHPTSCRVFQEIQLDRIQAIRGKERHQIIFCDLKVQVGHEDLARLTSCGNWSSCSRSCPSILAPSRLLTRRIVVVRSGIWWSLDNRSIIKLVVVGSGSLGVRKGIVRYRWVRWRAATIAEAIR